ncbi:hypothetical protein [Burkholderia multivorans]|uniref:hypothetical protein n=1 Tax=Burkholderia multivorans TaxID=87883 RepID=UPI0020A0BC3E
MNIVSATSALIARCDQRYARTAGAAARKRGGHAADRARAPIRAAPAAASCCRILRLDVFIVRYSLRLYGFRRTPSAGRP